MLHRITIFVLLALMPLTPFATDVEDSSAKSVSNFESIRAQLEKTKSEIITAEQKWRVKFEERTIFHHDQTANFSQIEARLKQQRVYENLLKDYTFVVEIWRKFADHSFENISGSNIERSFPSLPQLDDLVDDSIPESELLTLQNAYDELKELLNNALAGFDKLQDEDALGYNKVLLAAGKLRSQQYQRLEKLGYLSRSAFIKNNREDFVRELKIIPVRWTATFYSKLLVLRDYSQADIEGYFYILKEILIFLLLISFGVFFIWAFRKIVRFFENFAENIYKKHVSATSQGLWLYVLTVFNKSIPWVVLLFGVWFAISLLKTSSFNELSNLFPYIGFYIYYRIYLILADDLGLRIKTAGLIDLDADQQIKLARVNRSFGWLIFLSIATLHTIDTVVGKAMVYSLALNVLYVIDAVYIFYLTYLWSHEILNAKMWVEFTKKFTPTQRGLIEKFSFISSPFALLMILLLKAFNAFIYYLSQFDTFKKISAIMLRARLNKAEDSVNSRTERPLPQAYLDQFELNVLAKGFVTDRAEFKECQAIIQDWLDEKESLHSMLVYGSDGAGKSILLTELQKQISTSQSHIIVLDKKDISATGILSKIRNILGGESADFDELVQTWKLKKNKKTIIYIDNAHNLFLSKLNGFEGMQTLMNIINADIENVFWCVSFHRESWYYIRRALDEYLCFEKVIELQPSSAEELQKYIMSTHAKSGYKISFDKLLTILGKKKRSNARATIENRFFKLLWEQTEGNPTRAVQLWLKSLRYDGQNTIKVVKPPLENVSGFIDLDDDVHFMCAALVRHESLKREQIEAIIQQSGHVVTRLIKATLEKRIIVEDENGFFRINSDLSGHIIRSLRRKNYVYG